MTIRKEILMQCSDIRKEIGEVRQRINKLEAQIARIREEGNVIDTVRGGRGGIEHFRVEGFPYPEYSRKKTILCMRKTRLEELETELLEKLSQAEEFITGIEDSRMRRIVSMRCVENLQWNKIADRIGGGNTEASVRMAFNRFMEKK
ncbi:MAG: hypothetical protein K2J60_03565 [Acetatifactor sp.]|nr:hypothetical protein [Acetatifactor sp.]